MNDRSALSERPHVSMHSLAIRRIANLSDVPLHTRGLGKMLREIEAMYDIDMPDEDRPTRIPDAWSYEPHHDPTFPGTISLFEIEDTHPLSVDKLRDYADFFMNYDFYDLDVKLFVYDRYGQQKREICLSEYYMMLVCADAAQRNRNA